MKININDEHYKSYEEWHFTWLIAMFMILKNKLAITIDLLVISNKEVKTSDKFLRQNDNYVQKSKSVQK